ncbi:MAG: hypothetical protein FJW37_14905 [Acidobacteria bacterium]|nr:hypothetical protein [Acidobacteriota bacterium]
MSAWSFALGLAAGGWAFAGQLPPIPRYDAGRAGSKIVVDGRLDEPAWKPASAVELQFPWKQQTGPMQKTTVRLLWDNEFLYAGFDAQDRDILAHLDRRDDLTYQDDCVEVFINPDPAQSYYYGIEINAKGTFLDYFYAYPTTFIRHLDFVGIQVATHVRGTMNQTGDLDDGWTTEAAIPWRNFDEVARKLPPAVGTLWKINFNRWDGAEPRRRFSVWSDTGRPNPDPHNPARFGEVYFR